MKTFIISGTIGWNIDVTSLDKFLKSANGEEIAILINSPGGITADGFEMKNALQSYNGKVNIIMNAYALSMASYMTTVKGAMRYSMKYTVWLHHNVWGAIIGDYKELLKWGGIYNAMTDIMADEYIAVSKKKKSIIRQEMDAETWLLGSEIVENGFSDKIIESFKELNLEINESENNNLIFPFDQEKSKNDIISLAKVKFEIAKKEAYTKEINALTNINRIAALGLFPVAEPKNKGGYNMPKTLKELLAEDETLQKEFGLMLAESTKEKIETAVKAQRENIMAILEVSGMSMSEPIRTAIINGMDVKDYSVQELKAQAAAREKTPPQNFGALKDTTIPGQGVPGDEKSAERQKNIDGWDKAYNKADKK